jgi:hypothetical protein
MDKGISGLTGNCCERPGISHGSSEVYIRQEMKEWHAAVDVI